ncbi:flavin reductase family protein [Flexivirga meconopsidis]|uniref:flavin reductase family protein n=1 Tax=Flexivirga meconopsidis TaxID=2977121 RepID=UPI0022409987
MSVVQHTPDLRGTFRHAVSSAWVVTSAYDEVPVGFTAISVVSVSVSPPLVSFNLSKTSSSRTTIERSGRVALHLLADHQEHLAHRFAGDRNRRFEPDGEWHWHPDGLPALRDAVCRLDSRVVALTDAGDSFVVIAQVEAQETSGGRPLMHHHGSYHASPTDRLAEEAYR